MMALIRDGQLAEDSFTVVTDDAELPSEGGIVVSLERWNADRETLIDRKGPLGIRLRSDQSPELIAGDLNRFALVQLEFPQFRDGRAYSYARILRERYGFADEIRAVGEVLMEQLHYMQRSGFNAFELEADDPIAQYATAMADFSVWYQPAAGGRQTATDLRHRDRS